MPVLLHYPSRKTKLLLLCMLFIAAALLATASGLWVAHQVAIDRCLDAGGRYDYEAEECEAGLGE